MVVSQRSFRGETSGGVAKCRLFSQAILWAIEQFVLRTSWHPLVGNGTLQVQSHFPVTNFCE